jgi:hypothetical protein
MHFLMILLLPQELYTGGNDRQILVWSPARSIADEMVHSLKQFIEIILYMHGESTFQYV